MSIAGVSQVFFKLDVGASHHALTAKKGMGADGKTTVDLGGWYLKLADTTAGSPRVSMLLRSQHYFEQISDSIQGFPPDVAFMWLGFYSSDLYRDLVNRLCPIVSIQFTDALHQWCNRFLVLGNQRPHLRVANHEVGCRRVLVN